jgi:hypothetical protein
MKKKLRYKTSWKDYFAYKNQMLDNISQEIVNKLPNEHQSCLKDYNEMDADDNIGIDENRYNHF